MILGLDTGFFVRLSAGDNVAKETWNQIVRRDVSAVVSCLTLYELDKQGLKGAMDQTVVNTFVEELPQICRIIWLEGYGLLERAARLAHGNDLAMADAIILASLIEGEADRVYTTDSDFERYESGPEIMLL